MTNLLKKIRSFLGEEEALLLDEESIKEVKELSQRPFDQLDGEEQKKILELGAVDFSRKFSGVIKTLANE